jgi:hypothetical protein
MLVSTIRIIRMFYNNSSLNGARSQESGAKSATSRVTRPVVLGFCPSRAPFQESQELVLPNKDLNPEPAAPVPKTFRLKAVALDPFFLVNDDCVRRSVLLTIDRSP